jgi:hypothetical protein
MSPIFSKQNFYNYFFGFSKKEQKKARTKKKNYCKVQSEREARKSEELPSSPFNGAQKIVLMAATLFFKCHSLGL